MPSKYSFLVLKYPKADTAMAALATLKQLSNEKVVKLRDAVAITKNQKGKIKLHQTKDDSTGKGFVKGGLIGVVFAALFGPVGWIAMGAAAGGLFASFDRGIKNKLLKELGQDMTPSESALAILVEEAHWETAFARMKSHGYGGQLVVSEIVPGDLETVEKLLEDPKTVASVPEELEIAAPVAAAAAPAAPAAPVEEPAAPEPAAVATARDDLTQLAGIGPKAADGARGCRDHDLRGARRGQRAAAPPRAPRGRHGAPFQCCHLAHAGHVCREGRLAGPDEAQPEGVEGQQQGGEAEGRTSRGGVRRPGPAQWHRTADRLDPRCRRRDHLRPAGAHEHGEAARDHRRQWGAAPAEPRHAGPRRRPTR